MRRKRCAHLWMFAGVGVRPSYDYCIQLVCRDCYDGKQVGTYSCRVDAEAAIKVLETPDPAQREAAWWERVR